jgi:membrane dipeptidase
MRAVLHCIRTVGVDHCGIGADWDGGGGVRGFEDVTAIPQITLGLINAGYSEADIAKIWSGNLLRVFRAVEAERDRLARR